MRTDRVPDIEFGYWPQTIRRWLREGMPLDMTPEEQNMMFCPKLDRFLRHEEKHEHGLNLRWGMHPEFEERVVERHERSVTIVDKSGVLAQRFTSEADDSSIPHYLRFPIQDREDWRRMREERYRCDDPWRTIPASEIAAAREAAARGDMITVSAPGPYGVLRGWMGFENLSLAFYDNPVMIREMVEHMADLTVRQIRRLPDDLPIDYVMFWEDMAGKNGPFVSPTMFREFLQPAYHAIMTELRRHGCELGIVDCDGNPHDLVANWLEEGVNIMFPLEVSAGVDPCAWRREFGPQLRLRGGIAKAPLIEGGRAIDRELERVRPLLEEGGYVPHLDHLVPPDVSYANYRAYLDRKWKLIGKV
jgi:uroporphyrinogen decarboxylase